MCTDPSCTAHPSGAGRSVRSLGVPPLPATVALAVALLSSCSPSEPTDPAVGRGTTEAASPARAAGVPAAGPTVRVALFNVRELSADKLAEVDADGIGTHPQLRAAARIVQRVRPDVLVVQEIDVPAGAGAADPTAHARAFARHYLATGDDPLDYAHAYAAPVNTGVLSGHDLDNDGRVATEADRGSRGYGGDCLGWGTYPGQYGMAVLSQHPLVAEEARTFRSFLWRDLPGNHLPPAFYSDAELDVLPLSSKSHWDLPVEVAGRRLHLWVSHPTPPVFDGPEDRNGRRNFDEIRFWKLYLEAGEGGFPVDDAGRRGGYGAGAPFLVVGDLNADPQNEDAVYDGLQAAEQLLGHPALTDAGDLLTSPGARRVERVGGAHPERSTASFERGMRIDHLVPSRGLEVVDGGVFWPAAGDDPEGYRLAETASDHRLVWLDLRLP